MTTAPNAAGTPSPSSPSRLLGNGLIFLAALFISAWVIGLGLPLPNVPALTERYDYYASNHDQFDTLFVGSSRFRFQIVPHEFDTEAAAGGMPTRSLNVGYLGMWPLESLYFLRQCLDLKSPQLKWVVIELMDYRFGHADQEDPTVRMRHWHDAQHTAMACRVVWETPLPAPEKARLLGRHVGLFFQQTFNLGQGAEWAQARLIPKKRKGQPGWVARAGYEPEDERNWSEAARLDYERQIGEFRKSAPDVRVRLGFADALRDLVADVRRAGAEPIFVLAPTVHPGDNLRVGLPEGVTVLAFNNPDEYPRLYDVELHFDAGHLNDKGAHEFSRVLGRRFAESARRK